MKKNNRQQSEIITEQVACICFGRVEEVLKLRPRGSQERVSHLKTCPIVGDKNIL